MAGPGPTYHLRKHWKKYTFGAVASIFGSKYLAKRFRQNLIVRDYCEKAKVFGERRVGPFEKPRKVMVFLNPKAGNNEAKAHFTKYAAPLLHLSGANVTVVESEYAGQIRTLMGYIDPQTDAIMVAGGDGTMAEVVNGLMRRFDSADTRYIPIGVIPLGKENKFYRSHQPAPLSRSLPRRIGEATMDVITGTTSPVHIVELQPENGRTLYAVSAVEWGALKEAYENRDSFKLFGKLRLFMSHLNTAVRRWPTDYRLHIWLPSDALLLSENGGSPPPQGTQNPNSVGGHQYQSTEITASLKSRVVVPLLPPLYARCIHMQDIQKEQEAASGTAGSSPSGPHRPPSRLTPLAAEIDGRPDWKHVELDVVGFRLAHGVQGSKSQSSHCLKLTVWPQATSKGSFIQRGWAETKGEAPLPLPAREYQSSEFVLHPQSTLGEETWLSIDGEAYEAMAVAVRLLPNVLRLYGSHRSASSPSDRT